MYMRDPSEEFSDLRVVGSLKAALLVSSVGTLYLGILPTRALDWAASAAVAAFR